MEQLELQEAMDYHFPDNGTAKATAQWYDERREAGFFF